jgi:starch phosphorylase
LIKQSEQFVDLTVNRQPACKYTNKGVKTALLLVNSAKKEIRPMKKVRSFTVLPSLPEPLQELKTIANNMYWCWNSECVELFRRIDNSLWEACGHNPVKLLGAVSQARLEDLAENEGFLCELRLAAQRFRSWLEMPSWFEKVYTKSVKPVIAYFSAEFGIHECLPLYAGGLGILAGDHLKSASDLGVPVVAVGLFYQKGYFRQYLNSDGWQQEQYTDNDFYNMPAELVRKKSQNPLTISVQYPQRCVRAQIWCVKVGRVKLYLLDTNIPANSPADRMITATLYGGDTETRIQQEIMLGIGGFKTLCAVGVEPTVCHINEGHAALALFERIRHLRTLNRITFDEALEATRASNAFTVHTPVKAGNDEFSVELMDKYFSGYFPKLGISRKQFLGLGRMDENNDAEPFKLTVLGLRMSGYRNGVSELHGHISRRIWTQLWPDLPADEVPIQSITNGIHASSWVSGEMNSLFERYLGPNWSQEIVDKSVWKNIEQVPDEELWRAHQRCKERLISFIRRCLKAQMQRRGSYHTELGWAEEVLDPEALTIVFARRFASYKRGNLLLKDPQRLVKLLANSQRPVQIIFAGKAHPRDNEAKEIIRQIVHFAARNNVRHRMVFAEDYDISVARYLVQGSDLWLNNPRRPMEASGTSGMKASLNGALNLSTLDGWWCEGYQPDIGWVVGAGESYEDYVYQDNVESEAVYNLLENEVVPLFFTRSAGNVPRAWVKRMKNSIAFIAPRFNTHRMVAEYTRRFYNPAAATWNRLTSSSMARAKALAAWKTDIRDAWNELAIQDVTVQVTDGQSTHALDTRQTQLAVGSELLVNAKVKLGRIKPQDIKVEIYHGPVDAWGNIEEGSANRMNHDQSKDYNGVCVFTGSITCKSSGRHGFSLRILPTHGDLVDSYEAGLILWETDVTPPKEAAVATEKS